MPQNFNPGSGQDWGVVNVGRSTVANKSAVPKTARDLDRAKAAGLVATEKKFGAGGNKSAHSATALSAKKLEEADDVGKIARVDKSLSKAIMQARMAKKMTQKDLATAINEKPQVVGEYESGKAIPNPQIISKIERALGCKLPRPGKSQAPPKTGTAGAGAGAKKPGTGGAGGVTRGGPPKRR